MRDLTLPVPMGSLVQALASPRLTVAFFVLMAAAALAAAYFPSQITALVVTPLLLLLVNVGAALLTNARFRADLPLLLFHLALLAFLALLVAARLCYFDGGARLSAGAVFNGDYASIQQGPLHGDAPLRLRFANDGLVEHATAGGFPTTYNQVRWWDDAGLPHMAQIGNDRPLLLDGYRIYATNFRGFEPVFQWQPDHGAPQMGAVQLPYTFAGDFPEGSTVTLPGGAQAWVQLVSAENMEMTGRRDNLGAQTLKHQLILRVRDQRYAMQPGTVVELPGGRLTYAELSTWLGYRITYDPTPPWLAASVLVGVGSLLWFYARLWRRPRPDNQERDR